MKHLTSNFKFALFLLFIMPCLTAFAQQFPTITERGVGPFQIGKSISSIPKTGSFYNRVITEQCWMFVEGEDYSMLNKSEVNEGLNNDEFTLDDLVHIGSSTIYQNNEKLISVEYDYSDKIIKSIYIYSPKIKTANGLHVGISAADLKNKFNGELLIQEDFGLRAYFYIPKVSQKIHISPWSYNMWESITENEERSEWVSMIYDSNMESFPQYDWKNVYKTPLPYQKNLSIKSISIQRDPYTQWLGVWEE